MLAKKKICISCNTEQYIFSRKMCKVCASKNPKPKSNLREPVKKVLFKPSGELLLFQTIWSVRKHECAVCGENLKDFDIWNYSHILSKAAFPRFRLYDKNIVLKCRKHHQEWETKANSDLAKDPMWLSIIQLHQELIKEYYLERF